MGRFETVAQSGQRSPFHDERRPTWKRKLAVNWPCGTGASCSVRSRRQGPGRSGPSEFAWSWGTDPVTLPCSTWRSTGSCRGATRSVPFPQPSLVDSAYLNASVRANRPAPEIAEQTEAWCRSSHLRPFRRRSLFDPERTNDDDSTHRAAIGSLVPCRNDDVRPKLQEPVREFTHASRCPIWSRRGGPAG
jgi:hypothetical protein